MNFNLHFGELHSDTNINNKNNLFENNIPKCYNVKRILISFNCFSEYTFVSIRRTVKPVFSGLSKIDKTKVLKTNGSLMKVERISECSKRAFCHSFDLR